MVMYVSLEGNKSQISLLLEVKAGVKGVICDGARVIEIIFETMAVLACYTNVRSLS